MNASHCSQALVAPPAQVGGPLARPVAAHRPTFVSFAGASVSLLGIYIASGAPFALYETYRTQAGVSTADLSVVAVGYFVAAIVALLAFSRLSDYVGRRPVVLSALALAAVGCVLLMHVNGPGILVAGRVLQGLACGLASSTAAAFVVDSAPSRPSWLGAVVAGNAPMTGIVTGALLGGALVQYAPQPARLSYIITLAVLGLGFLLVVFSRESVAREPGALTSLRPQVRIPRRAWRMLPAATAVFAGTWAMGGFDQAFGPAVAAQGLGTHNAFVITAVFASLMVFGPLGGPMTANVDPATAQRLGMAAYLIAVIGMVAALWGEHVGWFIAASAVAGFAGLGVAFTGSVRALLGHAEMHERASVLAAIFAIAYCGSALPALVAGRLTHIASLHAITLGYAVVAAVATAVVMATARRPEIH